MDASGKTAVSGSPKMKKILISKAFEIKNQARMTRGDPRGPSPHEHEQAPPYAKLHTNALITANNQDKSHTGTAKSLGTP